MASLKHRSPPRGGAAAVLSFFCCVCALFAQSSVAFVPAGGLSRCGGVNDRPSSSCRAAAIGAAARSSLPVSRSSSRRGGRGGCAGGASSPLGMMFDTLAENMAGVANLFTGQKTITESRYTEQHVQHTLDTTHYPFDPSRRYEGSPSIVRPKNQKKQLTL